MVALGRCYEVGWFVIVLVFCQRKLHAEFGSFPFAELSKSLPSALFWQVLAIINLLPP
jgi:hypothetical protein